ncbi:MAG TPA: thioredoxin-like domain-containing protein [Planctomycetota bacterium]|nr:thioredoxin-like domain-containing protein [Planctomycetota bacterium]
MAHRIFSGALALALALICCCPSGDARAQAQARKAPELDGGVAWFNADRPVKMADLKGKVVLLDFWTFCCINCMHVIPDLQRLERKYAKELVVIGVHSAKFENEKDSESIRQAILRYDIEHPVVNDAEFAIWNKFGAKAWPFFVLIDPEGNIIGTASGEGQYEMFVRAIDEQIKKFDAKLNREELKFGSERSKVKPGALAFPGKILATADRLFIADTKHHRIVVTDHAGKVLDTVGGPDLGNKDGDFTTARFNEPQGMALKGSVLYVCDRQNHLIRQIDFGAKIVTTIAGTGKQLSHMAGGPALSTGLNSPWDVALDQDRLLIAMAGNHQIWALDPAKATIGPISGDGRENILDGPHARAEFSQPSGLSIQGGKAYVADSEISAVREVDLEANGRVRTIVGTGLFKFGDKDGIGDDVLLQHCIGLTWHNGTLYLADSYNHKIKTVDPKTRTVRTFLGDGKKGYQDGPRPRFHEPNGLAGWGDKLFIADTNNHAIRVCDLKTGNVTTLPVELK